MLEGSRHPLTRLHWSAAMTWASVAALAAGLASAAEATNEVQSSVKPVEANAATATAPPAMTLETFLDRLMMAESGGRDALRSASSTAVGSFQFIRDTFLDVVRRHFAEETASLSTLAILALRENRAFARRAAEAYAKDNAAHLAREGLPATFTNLRLAYLAGPGGAVRVLRAAPQTKVASLLSSAAIAANPFMANMSANELIGKCARDLAVDPKNTAGIAAEGLAGTLRTGPSFAINCNQKLPSCRRWVALREAQMKRGVARNERRQKTARAAQR